MPITHDPSNINGIIDWTTEINEIDNQFGFIRSLSLFNVTPTSQTSILFDKITNEIRLVPATNRRAKNKNVGKDRVVEQFAMALQYYSDNDYIDVQDIQDQRMPGQPDTEETFAHVRAVKLEDLKMAHDQTDEFLRYTAMKGDIPAGAATGSDNMYELFNLDIADFTVDLETQTATTDLDAKIAEVKRLIAGGIKAGSAISGIDFWLDQALFDEFLGHVKFREVYNQYVNNGTQRLRDENVDYFKWGVVDFFEHRGVRFMAYNPEFVEADGTVVKVLGDGEGIALPRGSRDLLRGYHGPANKLSMANKGGQELFSFERTSDDDESHILETQSTKLFLATKPAAIVQLT